MKFDWRNCVVLCCVCWISSVAFGAILEEALRMQLNQRGLDTIAEELSATALQPIESAPLPDFTNEVQLGIEATVEEASISVHFQNVGLLARSGGVGFSLGIKDAVVHAERIILKKKVLNRTIRTTCHDTDIYVGRNSAQTLSTNLAPSVVDGHLVIDAQDVAFEIAKHDYVVRGPGRCSGGVAISQVMSTLVRVILEKYQASIEESVKARVRETVPELTALMNETLRQQVEIDLGGTPHFPAQAIKIETSPFAVDTSTDNISLVMSVTAAHRVQKQYPQRDIAGEGPRSSTSESIGSVGLNPRVVEEILKMMFPNGTGWIELSNGTVQGLNEILRISSAASIWPDLIETTSSSEFLKLFIKLNQMPEFESGSGSQHIIARLPSLSLLFQIQRNGEWRDYYDFSLSTRAAARLDLVGDLLSVQLHSRPDLEIRGEWAEGYHPNHAEVELDMAEAMIRSVLDFLYYRGPLFSTGIPMLTLETADISLARPAVNGEFVQLELDRAR
jgi:hypothetical protein